MNISGVKPGDIVHADVLGRKFYALVDGPIDSEGVLPVHPISHNISYRHLTARQVKEHYRKAGRPRPKVAG